MLTIITAIEARVLGVLLEKSMATPEYYPLTLNAAINACNQKSNREPVMSLIESEVQDALGSLKEKHYVSERHTQGSRVQKYSHRLADHLIEKYMFKPQDLSVLCVLLLRGAQTAGEIRTRTTRLYTFPSLDQVQQTIQVLIARDDGPYMCLLPRESGRREQRYAHLLCGEDVTQQMSHDGPVTRQSSHRETNHRETNHSATDHSETDERLLALEQRVVKLEQALADFLE